MRANRLMQFVGMWPRLIVRNLREDYKNGETPKMEKNLWARVRLWPFSQK